MKSTAVLIGAALWLTLPSVGAAAEPDRPLFELDGASFVTFYDLPSRRFRIDPSGVHCEGISKRRAGISL